MTTHAFINQQTAVAVEAVDIVDAFAARAEARAYLWSVGELDFHEAVDELQADAERDGLVAEVGQDAMQAIMATAFAKVRR
jgi:hypothetical protein